MNPYPFAALAPSYSQHPLGLNATLCQNAFSLIKSEYPMLEHLIILVYAIFMVEASGNPHPPPGDSGLAIGPLQAHPCIVEDLNSWGYHFTLEDRKSLSKSTTMFILYTRHYAGADASDQDLSMTWHFGPQGASNPDLTYWHKVSRYMKEFPQ